MVGWLLLLSIVVCEMVFGGGDHAPKPQIHANNPEEKGGLEELHQIDNTACHGPLCSQTSPVVVYQKNAGIGIVYALE